MSQSTAMVMSGKSVDLTTLFSWACLTKQLTSTSCTYIRLLENVGQTKSMGPGRDRTRAPGSAVRHVTDCAMRPCYFSFLLELLDSLSEGDKYYTTHNSNFTASLIE